MRRGAGLATLRPDLAGDAVRSSAAPTTARTVGGPETDTRIDRASPDPYLYVRTRPEIHRVLRRLQYGLESATAGGDGMPGAIVWDQNRPIESRRAYEHRRRGSRSGTAEDAHPCDGCGARSESLCAVLPVVGSGTVVPSFRIAAQSFPTGHDIVVQGDSRHDFCVIIGGWAVLYELLEDGSRQILDFLLPGSVAGLQPDGEAQSPHCVQALTDVRACRFSRAGFLDAATSDPALALWLAAVASRSHYRSLRRLTLIGRRTAKARVAELLFELHRRARRLSLSSCEDEVSLPLTQEHIGDALGLTSVHVCRVLRELREEGVLVLKRGLLRLLDPGRLIEIVGDGDHWYAPHSQALTDARREAAGSIS